MKYLMFIISILISTVLLYLFYSNTKGKIENYNVELNRQIELNKILENRIIELLTFSERFNFDTIEIIDENNDTLIFSQFLPEKKKYYKFSESNCIDCVINDLRIIQQVTNQENVIVLTDNISNDKLYKLKKVFDLKIPIFRLVKWNDISLSQKNVAYFFKVNNSSIQHPFISILGQEDLTECYLNSSE